MADFTPAYERTMRFEGGYVNDPDDPGGETYRGITRRFNPGWEGWQMIDKARNAPDFPVCLDRLKALEKAVSKLYKQLYWDRFQGDSIACQDVADELFDTSVNLGVTRAVTFLQTALNVLNRNQTLYGDIIEDGICGPMTLKALEAYLRTEPPELLITVANILQGMHYIVSMRQSPVLEKFARGWLQRVVLGGRQ
jgi:lysozyme family protein